jgi:hypothetical protein
LKSGASRRFHKWKRGFAAPELRKRPNTTYFAGSPAAISQRIKIIPHGCIVRIKPQNLLQVRVDALKMQIIVFP